MQSHDNFPIVGIGASAGGVQALKDFFYNTPPDTGIVYVVILHLSPDYDSQLTEILRTVTKMEVVKVSEKVRIATNTIYVVPPNKHLIIENDSIIPVSNNHFEDRRAPVDMFFRHMSDIFGSRSIAVVLSGTGANGSMGLKRIKEMGGVVYVQNPKEAEFHDMPRNAIATDLVDEVLSVNEIPKSIIKYWKNKSNVKIELKSEDDSDNEMSKLIEIFVNLRNKTGHDFTNYKPATILRRIERRINIKNLQNLDEYVLYLKENPNESIALVKDLLISVTNFFRDKKAFEALAMEVIPIIIQDKSADDEVRIWIAGCATGEEVYSIAMLYMEAIDNLLTAPKVQIFGTDIDETAITIAREGLYTKNDVADISPERLRRFFSKEGEYYKVKREIREMVLFANHNFLKDPTFSRLDLISCRNVMIYLNRIGQRKILDTFHFALKPNAFLFLGSSESVDGLNDAYSVFNREQHVYRSRQKAVRDYPIPQTIPNYHLPVDNGMQKINERLFQGQRQLTFGDLHLKLLEEYAPPSVIVNEEYEILHMSSKVGRYMEIMGGEPSRNLLKLIRPELRLELRAALFQATKQQSAISAKGLTVSIDSTIESLSVHIRPVINPDNTAKGFILVVFEQESIEQPQKVLSSSAEPVAKQIEEELLRVKSQLRNSTEYHEFQAEELKASNEELQAMNEELRSSAEELETSKEELQSINEELRTVNQELKIKVEETGQTANNLQNLINSADIATIFLDRSFRIALFTPPVTSIFNLIESDFGRPITDITHKMNYSDVLKDAESVMDKLITVEKELTTTTGKTYTIRMVPYRTHDDHIGGVIITLFDISGLKQAQVGLLNSQKNYQLQLEAEVRQNAEELKKVKNNHSFLVENTPDIITRWDNKQKLVFVNTAFENKTRVKKEKVYGKSVLYMGEHFEFMLSYNQSLKTIYETGNPVELYSTYMGPKGEIYFFTKLVPEKNLANEVVSVLGIAHDITDMTLVQQELAEKQKEMLNTIIMTQEQERQRIGEALHNGVGQLLYAAQTRLQMINGKVTEDENYKNEALSIINDAINDTRTISFELVPSVLKDFGIEGAIRALLQKIVKGQIRIKFSIKNLPKRLPEALEFSLYRIIQELINNMLIHSKATESELEIIKKDSTIIINITDNGIGFDNNDNLSNGIGLANIKSRIKLMNGKITIKSNSKNGTAIQIKIPFINN